LLNKYCFAIRHPQVTAHKSSLFANQIAMSFYNSDCLRALSYNRLIYFLPAQSSSPLLPHTALTVYSDSFEIYSRLQYSSNHLSFEKRVQLQHFALKSAQKMPSHKFSPIAVVFHLLSNSCDLKSNP